MQTRQLELHQIQEACVIIPTAREDLLSWAEVIYYFLEKQENSWKTFWTINDWLMMIVEGKLIPCFYLDKGKPLGMGLFSINEYGQGRKSLRVEFLSCDNFFAITKMLEVVEERARLLGIFVIEAISHRTIAKYAVKKCGFEETSVYITKKLQPIRKH